MAPLRRFSAFLFHKTAVKKHSAMQGKFSVVQNVRSPMFDIVARAITAKNRRIKPPKRSRPMFLKYIAMRTKAIAVAITFQVVGLSAEESPK